MLRFHPSPVAPHRIAMQLVVVLLLALCGFARAADPDLLEPEKAFRFSARLKGPHSIEINYQIAPGYYLYRDKFRFVLSPAAAKAGSAQFPAGDKHRDEFFGEVETYRGNLSILLPFELADANVQAVQLAATSQGCADAGVCYIPFEQKAELKLAAFSQAPLRGDASPATAGKTTAWRRCWAADSGLPSRASSASACCSRSRPACCRWCRSLSGIIIGSRRNRHPDAGLLLAVVYVLGMAITYAIAGVAAACPGRCSRRRCRTPGCWAVCAVFVVLALSMFGFYELQLPIAHPEPALQCEQPVPRRARRRRVRDGRAIGADRRSLRRRAARGRAACTSARARDVVLGGSALFAMALGMGVPLLAVGASAGALLPKAGPWMDSVKRFFGVLLLAVAICLISRSRLCRCRCSLWAALLIGGGDLPAGDRPPCRPMRAARQRLWQGWWACVALLAGIA